MMKIQNYEIIEEIGNGNFSKVYKAIDKQTKQQFALKVMSSHKNIAEKQANLLKKIDHPNIAKFYQYVEDQQGFKLFLEYLPVNTLTLYQEHVCGLKQDQIKCILFQMALALNYIHERGLVHRDIKPENILIDKSKAIIKIIDFGLAINQQQMQTDYIATRWYRSPQNLLCTKEYTTAIDIFSLGCVIVQLYLGDPLFPGANNLDQISKIFYILGYPSKNQWPKGFNRLQQLEISPKQRTINLNTNNSQNKNSLKDILINCDEKLFQLISKMLILNPKQRISAKEIIKHDYFENIKQIIPPNVYERYEKDFIFTSKVSKSSSGISNNQPKSIGNQSLNNNKINLQKSYQRQCTKTLPSDFSLIKKHSQQFRQERCLNLQQSLHKKYSQSKEGLKFRQNNQLKMNTKLSLRQIKIKDHQQINRPLQPIPLINQNNYNFQNKPHFIHKIRKQNHSKSPRPWNFNLIKKIQQKNYVPSNPNYQTFNNDLKINNLSKFSPANNNSFKYLNFTPSIQNLLSINNQKNGNQKQPIIIIQKKPSINNLKPLSNFRTLDSSSPPQFLANNLSSDNINMLNLKNIQSSNKFRKASEQVRKQQNYFIPQRILQINNFQQKQHKQYKMSNNYQNLKLVESVHHKSFFPNQATDRNKIYDFRKNSVSERVNNLSATKHYPVNQKINEKSPKFNYLSIQQQNHKNNYQRFSKMQQSPKLLQNQFKGIRFSDWKSDLSFPQKKNQSNQISRQNITKNLSLVHPKNHKNSQFLKFTPTNKSQFIFLQFKNFSTSNKNKKKSDIKTQLKIIKSANSKYQQSDKKKQDKTFSPNISNIKMINSIGYINIDQDKMNLKKNYFQNNQQKLKESRQMKNVKLKTRQTQEEEKTFKKHFVSPVKNAKNLINFQNKSSSNVSVSNFQNQNKNLQYFTNINNSPQTYNYYSPYNQQKNNQANNGHFLINSPKTNQNLNYTSNYNHQNKNNQNFISPLDSKQASHYIYNQNYNHNINSSLKNYQINSNQNINHQNQNILNPRFINLNSQQHPCPHSQAYPNQNPHFFYNQTQYQNTQNINNAISPRFSNPQNNKLTSPRTTKQRHHQ